MKLSCMRVIDVFDPETCDTHNACELAGIDYMLSNIGNNWMKKIPRPAKIECGHRPSPIWQYEEFFEFNYFQIGQHVLCY